MQSQRISMAAARVNKGLTQKELAEMLGVSNHTVINWEKGKTAPNLWQLKKLSEIFGLSVEIFF